MDAPRGFCPAYEKLNNALVEMLKVYRERLPDEPLPFDANCALYDCVQSMKEGKCGENSSRRSTSVPKNSL